MTHGLIHKTVV